MRPTLLSTAALFLFLGAVHAGAQMPQHQPGQHHAPGHDHGGQLDVTNAWARATPGPVKTGAAYLTINNHRDAADRLLSAATDRAERAEVHEHVMQGDIAKMRHVDGVDVAGHSHFTFKPGGHHIMLMGLKAPLIKGGVFPLTLTFRNRGTVTIEVSILGVGSRGPVGDTMPGDHMPGQHMPGHHK